MKKGLIFVFGILSFLGINTVSAEEIYLEYDTNVNKVKPYIERVGYNTINNAIKKNIKYYNENLSSDYPYYFISLHVANYENTDQDKLYIFLTAFNETDKDYFSHYFDQTFDTSYLLNDISYGDSRQINYDIETNEISLVTYNEHGYELTLFDIDGTDNSYNVYNYYYSNFDLYYRGDLFPTSGSSGLTFLNSNDILWIPSFQDSSLYSTYKAYDVFLINPYYLYDDNSSLEDDKLTTINLNDYSYVILSLKDYSIKDSFETLAYIKGQLCPTTVYNYGTEEKKDYISGWQSPPCNNYFNDYTKSSLIIRKEDISNHAVYYFTTYDKSKDNLIKVDSSVFNISYFTAENENEPNVLIDGKNYLALPYSSLTDTSVNTHENGIDSTWTCAKYDTNCFLDSSGIDIDDLFSKPLETLETIWDTISSVFKLITEFISLLPPIMQGFLYLAFAVGISIGIIKIIL